MSETSDKIGKNPSEAGLVRTKKQRNPWILVGGLFLAWFVVAGILGSIPSVRESIEQGSFTTKEYNDVIVANDSNSPLYFVPCDDARCQVTPKGNHPADFNLITPGHSVDLKIERSQGGIRTFGIYDTDRQLQACMRFLSANGKTDPTTKQLSSIAEKCDAPSEMVSSEA